MTVGDYVRTLSNRNLAEFVVDFCDNIIEINFGKVKNVENKEEKIQGVLNSLNKEFK